MTPTERSDTERDRDLIVDRIYEIALEPSTLEEFINFWHDAAFETDISDFNTVYKSHLDRAESFLQWGEATRPDLSAYLRPYDNLAGFVVSRSLSIEASNSGAQSAFGVRAGDTMHQLSLPDDLRDALIDAVQDVSKKTTQTEKILRTDLARKGGAMLFRVVRINEHDETDPSVLIVSTHFHWRDQIGTLLQSLFQLTDAEQNVARLLIEGQDTNAIAQHRKTSEGTVRGQIKSIIAKMNLRSQKDIIRLIMTLGDFPKSVFANEVAPPAAPTLSKNWLEGEVWKPFKNITLTDGRTLYYHDMGPQTGHPVLFSHMGSCMVRWPRSMVRMAFDHDLRVICPIRAGYGLSDNADPASDTFDTVRKDCMQLLQFLKISKLPYVVQGSDFPFAADMIANQTGVITELIGIGARPCLPDGKSIDGLGRWQSFFSSAARNSPQLVSFASKAVMAMCKRIGPEAMLRQLCKDSPADLALLEVDEIRQTLIANIDLMAGKSHNAARAFAREYTAFQENWSDRIAATRDIPVHIYLAEEDPTLDIDAIPQLEDAYPWMSFNVVQNAGLALVFQRPGTWVPIMAEAAKRAASATSFTL